MIEGATERSNDRTLCRYPSPTWFVVCWVGVFLQGRMICYSGESVTSSDQSWSNSDRLWSELYVDTYIHGMGWSLAGTLMYVCVCERDGK